MFDIYYFQSPLAAKSVSEEQVFYLNTLLTLDPIQLYHTLNMVGLSSDIY
jgi:hypothetical protein